MAEQRTPVPGGVTPNASIRRPGEEPPDLPEDPDRPPQPPLETQEPVPTEPSPSPEPGPTTPVSGTLAPSVTSWTRLEPRCREADMRTTLAARIFDPLWLLARQWQMGEFQGEDVGTPVVARVRARSATLSRCWLGELPDTGPTPGALYDPRVMPLEVMVERQPARTASAAEPRTLRLRVEAGLHFLRMLELQQLSRNYRAAFIARFALQPPDPQAPELADEQSSRFVLTMAGRAMDGGRLEEACRGGAGAMVLDPALRIVAEDRAKVELAATRWLSWFDSLFSEPAAPEADAWLPERMEYAMTVAARMSEELTDEKPLTAIEFYDGHVDWSSFDLDYHTNLGTAGDRTVNSIVETTVPAPVTFRGTPAPRHWEFEDARIEYGLLPVGPNDLAQLLMIQYAGSYGNDWFVVPLTLPVGSLTRIDSLVVTDSFGVRTLLRPIGDPALPNPHWRMFQLAFLRRAGEIGRPGAEANLLFLPPALGRSLEGAAIEDVLFMRDEMANLAWAIERSVESAIELASPRGGSATASAEYTGPDDAPPSAGAAASRYLLSTTVPANWIPLLPVQLAVPSDSVPPEKIVLRLKRGAVLQPDGSQETHPALGRVLNHGSSLLLFDEEVPREGIHVTRHYQMARWIDGSTWLWVAHRKQVGRGEGSSGLRFDRL